MRYRQLQHLCHHQISLCSVGTSPLTFVTKPNGMLSIILGGFADQMKSNKNGRRADISSSGWCVPNGLAFRLSLFSSHSGIHSYECVRPVTQTGNSNCTLRIDCRKCLISVSRGRVASLKYQDTKNAVLN